MSTSRLDAVIHPVRLRILALFSSDSRLTTKQILSLLSEVPQGSVYRHIRKMVDAGVLDVVDEQNVKGAIEKTYALNASQALFSAADIQDAAPEELQEYFTLLVIELLRELHHTTVMDEFPMTFSFLKSTRYFTQEELSSFGQAFLQALESIGSSTYETGKSKWSVTFALAKQDDVEENSQK